MSYAFNVFPSTSDDEDEGHSQTWLNFDEQFHISLEFI